VVSDMLGLVRQLRGESPRTFEAPPAK